MINYENRIPVHKTIKKAKPETEDFLVRIIKYLPIITLSCLGIGILNLKIYYYPFNLNILDYTDLNEIIFETFSNLLICAAFFLGHLLFVELTVFFRYRVLKITQSNDKRINSGISFSLKTLHIIYVFIIVLFTGLLMAYIKFIGNDLLKNIHKDLLLLGIGIYVISVLVVTVMFYVDLFFQTVYFRPFNAKYHIVISALYFVFFYTAMFSIHSSVDIKLLSTYGSYIKIGNEKIFSTQSYYYIGRSKNYVFFYDVLKESTDVYQSKDINLLSLSTGGFGVKADKLLKSRKIDTNLRNIKLVDSVILTRK